jgi:fructose-1,6-bisphosphatase/inositol monophosphatase family enzyme
MIAAYDLVAAVPEHVRDQYETCRKLHVYGCFAYEFFTVAAERAYFVVKAKAWEFHLQGVPQTVIARGLGIAATMVDDYWSVIRDLTRAATCLTAPIVRSTLDLIE